METSNKQLYAKQQYIEEKKNILKQLYKELKSEKEERHTHEKKMKEQTEEIAELKLQVEDLEKRLANKLDVDIKGNNNDKQSPNVKTSFESIDNMKLNEGIAGGSGGNQETKSDNTNTRIIEYSIEVENLKNAVKDLEDRLNLKEEQVESSNIQLSESLSKIKDLEAKRKYAVSEIQDLKLKMSALKNSADTFNSPDEKNKYDSEFMPSATNFGGPLDSKNSNEAHIQVQSLVINNLKFENFSVKL